MNSIITRFAPSPTGNLHIGGVRTALINYIITQQNKKSYKNSKFLLRIEDTDKLRSNNDFKTNIIDSLKWLNIDYDDEIYIQSEKIIRHKEIAYELLKKNKAFKCICTSEVLQKKREENRKNKINLKRLCENCEENKDIQSLEEGFAVRIKIPNSQQIKIKDLIQNEITIQNKELDNFIILRNDGSPTYMLSVVVDDYDMGVNLIIRGDDHLNNAFRQISIYQNMNWPIPQYAHLSLINGENGEKLSKRHGAVNIKELKEKGYLKESIINNLILLGWAPPNKNEIISINSIIDLFDIKKISKSASIFSYKKLDFFNNHYIKSDQDLINLTNYSKNNPNLRLYLDKDMEKYKRVFKIYQKKINFYKDLESIIPIYFNEEYITNKNDLLDINFNNLIKDFYGILEKVNKWEIEILENKLSDFIDSKDIKFVIFGKPLRVMLINEINGPSISDILYILGKKNSLHRINNYIKSL